MSQRRGFIYEQTLPLYPALYSVYSFQHCDQHPPDPFLGTLYQSCWDLFMGSCSSFGFSTLRSFCRPGAVDSCSDPTLGVFWWSVREVVAALSYKPQKRGFSQSLLIAIQGVGHFCRLRGFKVFWCMYSDDPSPSFRVLCRPHQGPDSGVDNLLRLAVEISLRFGSWWSAPCL